MKPVEQETASAPISKRRKHLRIILSLILLTGLGLILWSFWWEPDRLVVAETTIALPQWPPALNNLKVVALSDIHTGAPYIDPDKLAQLVDAVNQLQPDLVVILGDLVIQGVVGGAFVEPEVTAGKLKELRPRLGTFAVLGNHDWWYDGDRIMRALNEVGIKVLENEVAEVQLNGQSLWLAGLADLWTRQPRIEPTLQKVPAGQPVLVLTHNPDLFPQIPARVSLTLAGHTHGGQVNLPLIGRPQVPSRFGQRFAIGHIEEAQRHLFVTPGVGTSIIPVRFRVPPEISLLSLIAQDSN